MSDACERSRGDFPSRSAYAGKAGDGIGKFAVTDVMPAKNIPFSGLPFERGEPVPEPATALLTLLGAIGTGLVARQSAIGRRGKRS